jgi:hypothetical protein
VRNTVINNGSNGQFLHVGGAVDGVTLDNNLYVAPSLETGPYSAAPVDVDNGDLTGFRSISDNVWPQPTMHDGSGAGINIVGSYKTATQWEAYVQVDHDQFKDVTHDHARRCFGGRGSDQIRTLESFDDRVAVIDDRGESLDRRCFSVAWPSRPCFEKTWAERPCYETDASSCFDYRRSSKPAVGQRSTRGMVPRSRADGRR